MNIDNININIEELREQWAIALMTRGVIVELNISKWAGITSLKPEELGLKYKNADTSNTARKYLNLGSEKLLPPHARKEIIFLYQCARSNLQQYSFKTIWGYFMPYSSFKEWHEQNEEIKEQYLEAVRQLILKYDDIVNTVREDYKLIAEDAWFRMHPESQEAPPSYISNFVNNVISKIPPREELAQKFQYTTMYYKIPLPSFIQHDLEKVETIKKEFDVKRQNIIHESELERETREQIEKEYRSQKKQLIDSFLETTVNALRTNVDEICTHVLESMGKNKNKAQFSQTNMERINKLIQEVELLNFYNDQEIANILKDLKREVIKFKSERNDEYIKGKLSQICEIARKEFSPVDFMDSFPSEMAV